MPTITDAIFPHPIGPPIGPPVPPTGPPPLQYQHTTMQDNIKFPWYWTQLDYPALNGNPVAIITVTPVGRIQVNNQAATATIIQIPVQSEWCTTPWATSVGTSTTWGWKR
jgi:hypothetical protein